MTAGKNQSTGVSHGIEEAPNRPAKPRAYPKAGARFSDNVGKIVTDSTRKHRFHRTPAYSDGVQIRPECRHFPSVVV